MKKLKFLAAAAAIAAAAALISPPTSVFADTIIDNDIATSTTWTKTESPYLISHLLTVASEVTLTLEPGTIVKFDSSAGLHFLGKLEAFGSSTDMIQFTSPLPNSFWQGLSFDGASSSASFKNVVLNRSSGGISFSHSSGEMENFQMANSRSGIEIGNGSSLAVSGSKFEDMQGTVFQAYESSILNLSSTTISHLSPGAYGISIYNGSRLSLTNSTTSDLEGGIALNIFNNSQAVVSSSTIKNVETDNNSNAIDVYNNSHLTFNNSLLENINGDSGILLFNNSSANTGLSISNSQINQGAGDGIDIYDDTNVAIENSSIINFGQNGLSYYGQAPISAENNWWGQPSGPHHPTLNPSGSGSRILGKVTFTPWLTSNPFEWATSTATTTATTGSSIIFLPGILGSRLYSHGLLTENQLWEPNRNADAVKLFLDQNGQSIDAGIYTRDIINKTNILPLGFLAKDIYQDFSDSMDALVESGTINAWKPIPYDWRQDYNDIIENGIKLPNNNRLFLADEIERMASASKTGKVTLITHSNGGLLAKALIEYLRAQNHPIPIDKLIMIAVPELGTPSTLGAMLHGDGQAIRKFGYSFMKQDTARSLSENMPSAYNLLPNQAFLERASSSLIAFDPSVDRVNNFRERYGDNITAFNDLSDFLLGRRDGRAKPPASNVNSPNVLNSQLLERSFNLHQSLDSLPSLADLSEIRVLGLGLPTNLAIKYFGKESCLIETLNCQYILDHSAVSTVSGDGTVLKASAAGESNDYYLNLYKFNKDNRKNRTHADIMEAPPLLNLIGSIISGSSTFSSPFISQNIPNISNARLEIDVHSPVSIEAYNGFGNHTGIISSNIATSSEPDLVEEGIPNSAYADSGELKNLILGDDQYRVRLLGLGLGSFSLEEKIMIGDQMSKNNFWNNLPITPLSVIELNLSSASSTPVLTIDVDGDGQFDANISATSSATLLDPSLYLALIKKIIISMRLGNGQETSLLRKVDNILRSIAQGKVKNAEKKIKAFNRSLEIQSSHIRQHGSAVSASDVAIFVNLMNRLLDTLAGPN